MSTNKVVQVNGNMVTVRVSIPVQMNEVAYICLSNKTDEKSSEIKLKSEVIRIKGKNCDLQVFEDTSDIYIGDEVFFTSELLSIELGPGLLGNVYDGLGNPLTELAEETGLFLKKGIYLPTINRKKKWDFKVIAKIGDILKRGNTIGIVIENNYDHRIMIPFNITSDVKIITIVDSGNYKVDDIVCTVEDTKTKKMISITMVQKWPIKIGITFYQERLQPCNPLITKMRIVDLIFPIAEGGTACIPGPFGSGKTVFQQAISKYASADIVIVAACGERAGEVVETLKEFPELIDPRTGTPLIERTIIICNTSSMPVAAREASVYTAMTIAEYYRHMGLRVLVLADSTSRWAQALREMSGRLEEIPGEEAFPAYLRSLIAAFYERAGYVRISDPNLKETTGSVTLIGTVSPAGGNFEEPVTQSTLAVVGCFWGLTYARSYAKRFPAISPIDSWSKYLDILKDKLNDIYYKEFVNDSKWLLKYYIDGQRIGDQMKVVGEEDLSISDFIHFHKSEFFDAVILQQNSFDDVDAGPDIERTSNILKLVKKVILHEFNFITKDDVHKMIMQLISMFRELNITNEESSDFKDIITNINILLEKS